MSSRIDSDKLSSILSEILNKLEVLRTSCISDPGNVKEILSDALEQLHITLEELLAINEKFMPGDEEFLNATIKSRVGSRLLAESVPHLYNMVSSE
jgi:hypothetical protein